MQASMRSGLFGERVALFNFLQALVLLPAEKGCNALQMLSQVLREVSIYLQKVFIVVVVERVDVLA